MTDRNALPGWNKARFDWKSRIFEAQGLSRGAKNLAAVLCDTFADRRTGKCWPSNDLLANKLHVTVRTVQRYIRELKGQGWLVSAFIPRRRRGLQLAFPRSQEDDTKGDSLRSVSMTKPSSKHDKTVVPYTKEPNKNQKQAFRTIAVHTSEAQSIEAWTEWLESALENEAREFLEAVKREDIYYLPSRFPSMSQENEHRQRTYFLSRIKAKKRMLDCPSKLEADAHRETSSADAK